MTKQVQRRRGTATQHTSFTGAEGELSVNTTNKSVHVHDNVTAGGFEAARADMDNVTSSSILTAAGITATTAELNYVDGVTSNIQTQLDGKAGTASPTFTGTLTTANLTATGTTTLAGASTSADITFGDNDKAIFGAGSDLTIFSDGGTFSYINNTQGILRIRNTSDDQDVVIQSDNGSGGVTDYFTADGSTGAAILHNYGATKLATTATGVDITGTLTSDGLTVNGNATIQQDDALIFIKETDGTNIAAVGDLTGAGQGGAFYYDHGGTATIQLKSYEASTIENGLNVKGDISFYEDTGNTAKLTWDASAEMLTTSGLTVDGDATISSNVPTLLLNDTDNNIEHKIIGSGNGDLEISADSNNVGSLSSQILFKVDGTLRAKIGQGSQGGDISFYEDTGNTAKFFWNASAESLGIGTTSPATPLHIVTSGNTAATFHSTTDNSNLVFTDASTTANVAIGAVSGNNFRVQVNNAERMRVTSGGDVGIGTSSPSQALHIANSGFAYARMQSTGYGGTGFDIGQHTGGSIYLNNRDNTSIILQTNNTERMRLTAAGQLLIGRTATSGVSDGHRFDANGFTQHVRNGGSVLELSRETSDGDIQVFKKGTATVGSIGVTSSGANIYYTGGSVKSGVEYGSSAWIPWYNGARSDDFVDLGVVSARFDDIYATNGTIQTSDRNEKQDIAELSDAEQRVAVAAKGLLRKFRWRDSVEAKGDEARTHFGIIAQDLQAAFAAEGLDAGDYAMFISSTWTDEETGEERTRMGVRYSELLAFIIAAI